MGERETEILTAIVETFISTGEPVGSRVLARVSREGLSAATVRNVMADLSDAGYLEQPHTSAGRVPTSAAYRYYVEQLTGKAQIAPADANMIQGVVPRYLSAPQPKPMHTRSPTSSSLTARNARPAADPS